MYLFFFSVKVQREEGFHVDLDDYLMGLLQLAGELVSVHVSIQDYEFHCTVAKFGADPNILLNFASNNSKNSDL